MQAKLGEACSNFCTDMAGCVRGRVVGYTRGWDNVAGYTARLDTKQKQIGLDKQDRL